MVEVLPVPPGQDPAGPSDRALKLSAISPRGRPCMTSNRTLLSSSECSHVCKPSAPSSCRTSLPLTH
eukprot:5794081-Prorocentrum_lima.AAC.1